MDDQGTRYLPSLPVRAIQTPRTSPLPARTAAVPTTDVSTPLGPPDETPAVAEAPETELMQRNQPWHKHLGQRGDSNGKQQRVQKIFLAPRHSTVTAGKPQRRPQHMTVTTTQQHVKTAMKQTRKTLLTVLTPVHALAQLY